MQATVVTDLVTHDAASHLPNAACAVQVVTITMLFLQFLVDGMWVFHFRCLFALYCLFTRLCIRMELLCLTLFGRNSNATQSAG